MMAEYLECAHGSSFLVRPSARAARPRHPSYFQPRNAHWEDEPEDPVVQKLRYFYRELSHFCQLKSVPGIRSSCQCFATSDRFCDECEERKIENFVKLRTCTGGSEESNDDHLFSLVFLSELQTLGQGIQRNNVLVEGLFCCIREKVNERLGMKPRHGPDSTAIVNLSQGMAGLLEHYWHPPPNASELPTYVTVGKSFVQFVRSQFGRSGISSMVRQLALMESEALSDVQLTIRRNSLQDLEAKWLLCLKYESQSKCQISGLKFFFLLLKLSLKSSGCLVFLACLFFLADVGLYIYNTIAFGELSGIASVAAQDSNATHLFRLVQPASLLLGTVIMRCFAFVALSGLMSCVAIRLSRTLQNRIITAIYSQPLELQQDKLMSMFTQDVAQLEVGVGFALVNVIRGLVVSIASIIIIIGIIWQLGLPLALAFVGIEIFLSLLGRKLGYYSFRQELATSKLSSVVREVIDGHVENRVFGLFNYWIGRYQTLYVDVYRQKAFKSLFMSQVLFILHFFIPLLLSTGVVIGAFTLVVFGYATFSNALTSFILFASSASALRVSGSFLPMLEKARTALSRILTLCGNASDADCSLQSPSEFHPEEGSAAVSLDNVSFAYSLNSAYWQLHSISLSVNHGERVAIVGPSGSGKSTLLKVIMGYYKPAEGDVFVYGHNMTTTSVSSLPVSVVTQHSHFFHNMSILQNLQLANWTAELSDVQRAVESSGLQEWISSLPQGYNTIVSSDFSMSHGQRQRLGLARSLLKQPKLLILDEVTSALDPITSKSVFENILKVTRNFSVVAVTHSLEEAMMFDRIVLVSHGVVKECGSHGELMSAKGDYFRMWKNIAFPEDRNQLVGRSSLLSSHRGGINAKMYLDGGQPQRRRVSLPSVLFASGTDCGYVGSAGDNAPKFQLPTVEEVETVSRISVSADAYVNGIATSSHVAQSSSVLCNRSGGGDSVFASLSMPLADRSGPVNVSSQSIHSQLLVPMQASTPKGALVGPQLEREESTSSLNNLHCVKLCSMDTTLSASELPYPVPPGLNPKSVSLAGVGDSPVVHTALHTTR